MLHVIETWSQYRIPTVQHFRVSFSHRHECLKECFVKMIEVAGREVKSPVRISGSGQSRRLCSLTEVEKSLDCLIDHLVLTVHRNVREKSLRCGRAPKEH